MREKKHGLKVNSTPLSLKSSGVCSRSALNHNTSPKPDESIAAIAARANLDPQAVLYDYMCERGGHALVYFPLLNYADFNFDAIRTQLLDDNALLSLSDGGAHCGLICDVSTSTFMLSYWARDRQRGERIDLERVVRMQTMDTARAYGLNDRGVLRPGYKADINIIDFDNLNISTPEMAYDLPAGGRRLIQHARGYDATLVAGQVIFEQGQATGTLPGMLLRGPQAHPK